MTTYSFLIIADLEGGNYASPELSGKSREALRLFPSDKRELRIDRYPSIHIFYPEETQNGRNVIFQVSLGIIYNYLLMFEQDAFWNYYGKRDETQTKIATSVLSSKFDNIPKDFRQRLLGDHLFESLGDHSDPYLISKAEKFGNDFGLDESSALVLAKEYVMDKAAQIILSLNLFTDPLRNFLKSFLVYLYRSDDRDLVNNLLPIISGMTSTRYEDLTIDEKAQICLYVGQFNSYSQDKDLLSGMMSNERMTKNMLGEILVVKNDWIHNHEGAAFGDLKILSPGLSLRRLTFLETYSLPEELKSIFPKEVQSQFDKLVFMSHTCSKQHNLGRKIDITNEIANFYRGDSFTQEEYDLLEETRSKILDKSLWGELSPYVFIIRELAPRLLPFLLDVPTFSTILQLVFPEETTERQRPASPRMTERPASPRMTERPTSPRMTERPASPRMTERPASPRMTERPASPRMTERPASPRMTERPASPRMTERPASPRMTERPTSPRMTERPASPRMTERPASPPREPGKLIVLESPVPNTDIPEEFTLGEPKITYRSSLMTRGESPTISSKTNLPQVAAVDPKKRPALLLPILPKKQAIQVPTTLVAPKGVAGDPVKTDRPTLIPTSSRQLPSRVTTEPVTAAGPVTVTPSLLKAAAGPQGPPETLVPQKTSAAAPRLLKAAGPVTVTPSLVTPAAGPQGPPETLVPQKTSAAAPRLLKAAGPVTVTPSLLKAAAGPQGPPETLVPQKPLAAAPRLLKAAGPVTVTPSLLKAAAGPQGPPETLVPQKPSAAAPRLLKAAGPVTVTPSLVTPAAGPQGPPETLVPQKPLAAAPRLLKAAGPVTVTPSLLKAAAGPQGPPETLVPQKPSAAAPRLLKAAGPVTVTPSLLKAAAGPQGPPETLVPQKPSAAAPRLLKAAGPVKTDIPPLIPTSPRQLTPRGTTEPVTAAALSLVPAPPRSLITRGTTEPVTAVRPPLFPASTRLLTPRGTTRPVTVAGPVTAPKTLVTQRVPAGTLPVPITAAKPALVPTTQTETHRPPLSLPPAKGVKKINFSGF
jgi:hypothetical protein